MKCKAILKFCATAVCAVIMFGAVNVLPSELIQPTVVKAAASDFTAEQGAQWGRDRVSEGWEVDVDGVNGCQCIDLIQAYGSYLGVYVPSLMAYQYETWGLPSGWTRTYGSPQIGDIFVMNPSAAGSSAGHVGLVTGVNGSLVTTAETNYWSYHYGNAKCRSVTRDVSKYTCFIHPNFRSASITPSKPNPVTVNDGYASMTTIFSWDACSNATSYDLRLYTSSSLSDESRIDNYGSLIKVKNTSYSVMLPQGDYWVTIASVNDTYGTYQFAENATKFTVKAPDNYLPCAVEKYNDHVYAFYDYATYYEQAEKLSEQFGGHLVTISDKEENDTVAKLIGNNKKAWLGLIRNKSGEFEWIDGTTLSYTNWSEGEPNNDGGVENYGVIYSSGEWNDSYTGKYPTGYFYRFGGFIVEYEPNDIKPTQTTVYNGHQYEYYSIPVGYDLAQEICEKLDGHLVTISDKEENDTVAKLIGNNKKAWLGLIRNKSGEFEWTDGTTLSYTNWSEGEPNNDGGVENYGVIYSSGEWNDSYTGKYPTGDFYTYCGFVLERNIIKGDINSDGEFTVADVVLLQKWLLAVPDTYLSNWKAADFYEDEKLNVFDLCVMKSEFLKK